MILTPSLQGRGTAPAASSLEWRGRPEVSDSGASPCQGQPQLPRCRAASGGGEVDQEWHPGGRSQHQHSQSHKGRWLRRTNNKRLFVWGLSILNSEMSSVFLLLFWLFWRLLLIWGWEIKILFNLRKQTWHFTPSVWVFRMENTIFISICRRLINNKQWNVI